MPERWYFRELLICASLLFARTALAQSSASSMAIAFDVVSIRPNHTGAPGMIDRTPPDGYKVENYPVRSLVSNAYGIRLDLISGGPGWIDSECYDVSAKIAGEDVAAYRALSKDQRNQMLQRVLAERFHLVAHTVVKELPGYTLTISRNGPKLVEAKPEGRGWSTGPGSIKAGAMTTSTLAEQLSRLLRKSVLDQTGLTGNYSFTLTWADLQSSPRPPDSVATSGADSLQASGLPALPTALEEELGLKLNAAKLPTTTLVIDSIDRPSEN
jgi:uncharacterized protein (TIGR03435 family)